MQLTNQIELINFANTIVEHIFVCSFIFAHQSCDRHDVMITSTSHLNIIEWFKICYSISSKICFLHRKSTEQ